MLQKFLLVGFCLLVPSFSMADEASSLPPGTSAILNQIYSGRGDLAIAGARQFQQQRPDDPLGYLLEGEARWWQIWCSSAEYKYGMTMPRHRDKLAADQTYLELASKALTLAEAKIKVRPSGQMYLYAGMAEALAVRLYALRWETRTAARGGVHAREYFSRALELDPSLADADMGLGLYDYYVDTLSTMARVLRFFMGIPGGSKEEGIRRLMHSMNDGQLTRENARFYLAIDLHNYDQRYEEALKLMGPLVQQYPENPLFLLAQGDLYAKLGRKSPALAAYNAAAAAAGKMPDLECRKKVELLVEQSVAAISAAP
jgi:tetratricopeptide (TPR) repeat protein